MMKYYQVFKKHVHRLQKGTRCKSSRNTAGEPQPSRTSQSCHRKAQENQRKVTISHTDEQRTRITQALFKSHV